MAPKADAIICVILASFYDDDGNSNWAMKMHAESRSLLRILAFKYEPEYYSLLFHLYMVYQVAYLV